MTTTEVVGPNAMLEAAEIRYQEVRHRIGADDPTVTARDLEEEESALRFARTRLEAARELERQREDQARQDRIAEIRASLPEIFDTKALDAAFEKLQVALDAYCDEAQAMQSRVSEVYTQIAAIPDSGISVQPSAWVGVTIAGYRAPHYGQKVFDAATKAFSQRRLDWPFSGQGRR